MFEEVRSGGWRSPSLVLHVKHSISGFSFVFLIVKAFNRGMGTPVAYISVSVASHCVHFVLHCFALYSTFGIVYYYYFAFPNGIHVDLFP